VRLRATRGPTRAAAVLLTALGAALALTRAAGPGTQPAPFPGGINDPNLAGSNLMVTPDEGPLVVPGPAPDLILLYAGRAQGYIEPCG
jgi:hypothetical protein